MLTATRYKLSRVRMLQLLEELKGLSIGCSSLYIPPESSKTNIEGSVNKIVDTRELSESLPELIAESPTGAVLFWGPHYRCLAQPSFPIKEDGAFNTCEIEPLSSLLNRKFMVGLVLVRLGAYGIGIYRGEELITGKVGTGLVHARHRQGGSSAHRFERHREKQMESFFTRICTHAREQLEPYSRQLEYLFYGGARETILEFRKQCRYLHEFDNRTLDRLLNIREPKRSGLEEGIREAWSSRIIEWK